MLAEGYSNGGIAKRLCVTKHTVKAHLESIFEKLQVHNRVQAVIKAIRLKLIEI